MTDSTAQALPAPRPRATGSVVVWDPLVRIFHWSFAAVIAAAWLTHEGEGSTRALHEWIGYSAATLVAVRISWGFVGTQYARFTEFVPGPKRLYAASWDTIPWAP